MEKSVDADKFVSKAKFSDGRTVSYVGAIALRQAQDNPELSRGTA
jgi:hypothetical protein